MKENMILLFVQLHFIDSSKAFQFSYTLSKKICHIWKDTSEKDYWDAGSKCSTVTLKSSHPDPASRFTAPVLADFQLKWVSQCHSQHPLALSVATPPSHCYSSESQSAACSTLSKEVNSCLMISSSPSSLNTTVTV